MRAMNETSAGQTTCAAFWVKGIAETLEAAGLDIPALFEVAELELAALSNADARFPTEGISRLWQIAATRSGNPAIGLTNSSAVKPGSFDVVAYTMMSSPNLLGILERAVRYVDILLLPMGYQSRFTSAGVRTEVSAACRSSVVPGCFQMPIALQCAGECLTVRAHRCDPVTADGQCAAHRGARADRQRAPPAAGPCPDVPSNARADYPALARW